MRKFLFTISFFAIFLSSCGAVTPAPEMLSNPKDEIIHPELDVIDSENINKLEEVGKWGESVLYDVAVSPDKQTIAVRTIDGIHFFDSKTLIEKRFLEDEMSYTRDLSLTISYSPDGKYLITSVNSFVAIYNLNTNEYEKRFSSPIPDANITDIVMTQDNHYAVVTTRTSSTHCDGTGNNFALYDISNEYGKLLFDRYFCYPSYPKYRFTTNGRMYFWHTSGVMPYQLDVIDLKLGGLIESAFYDYENIDPNKTFYDVSPDGMVFASVGYEDGQAITRIVDAQTGNVLQTIKGIITFFVSADGSINWKEISQTPNVKVNEGCKFVVGGLDSYYEVLSNGNLLTIVLLNSYRPQSLEIWDQNICKMKKQISFLPNDQSVFQPKGKFSSDGKLFARISGFNIDVWDVKTGRVRFIAQNPIFRFPLNTFDFNSDGTRLIASTLSNSSDQESLYKKYSLSVWDTQTGELLFTKETGYEHLTGIIASPDRNDLIAATDKEVVHLWSINSGREIMSLPAGRPVFTQIGVWVLHAELENKLSLYDLSTGQLLKTIKLTDPNVGDFYVSDDELKIALITWNPDVHMEYLVRIDANSGAEIYRDALGKDVVYSEAKGDYFATYNLTGLIDVWDFYHQVPLQHITGYYTINTRRNLDEYLSIPSNSIHEIDISPNGQFIASFDLNNDIRLWNAQSGNLIGGIKPSFDVTSIAISPDGRLIVVSGKDGFVRVWGVKKQ